MYIVGLTGLNNRHKTIFFVSVPHSRPHHTLTGKPLLIILWSTYCYRVIWANTTIFFQISQKFTQVSTQMQIERPCRVFFKGYLNQTWYSQSPQELNPATKLFHLHRPRKLTLTLEVNGVSLVRRSSLFDSDAQQFSSFFCLLFCPPWQTLIILWIISIMTRDIPHWPLH